MILVDTSVWLDHFRRGNRALAARLESGEVATHPFIIGELACGNLHRRRETLGNLSALASVPVATHDEVLALLETRRLIGKGLGWIDMHLLCSALLAGVRLLTLDKSLGAACGVLGIREDA